MSLFESGDSNGSIALSDLFIEHLRNGSYALIEVKLGGKEIDIAAENLLRLKSKIDTDRMKAPSFLMIVTGTDFAYRRKDGVFVVPLGCLKD